MRVRFDFNFCISCFLSFPFHLHSCLYILLFSLLTFYLFPLSSRSPLILFLSYNLPFFISFSSFLLIIYIFHLLFLFSFSLRSPFLHLSSILSFSSPVVSIVSFPSSSPFPLYALFPCFSFSFSSLPFFLLYFLLFLLFLNFIFLCSLFLFPLFSFPLLPTLSIFPLYFVHPSLSLLPPFRSSSLSLSSPFIFFFLFFPFHFPCTILFLSFPSFSSPFPLLSSPSSSSYSFNFPLFLIYPPLLPLLLPLPISFFLSYPPPPPPSSISFLLIPLLKLQFKIYCKALFVYSDTN